MPHSCTHLEFVKTSKRNSNGCEECLKSGDSWVHLGLCYVDSVVMQLD